MSEQLTVVVHIKAKAGKEEQVKQELKKLLGPTRIENGCINYDMHQSQDDPALFLFHENWTSEQALKAHFETRHIQEWLKISKELLAEDMDLKLWKKVE